MLNKVLSLAKSLRQRFPICVTPRNFFGTTQNVKLEPHEKCVGLFDRKNRKDNEVDPTDQNQAIKSAKAFSNMLHELLRSLRLLNTLDSTLLDDLCRVFAIYDPEHADRQKETHEMARLCLLGRKEEPQFNEIFSALRKVVEFFDQSESGLLKGDLHSSGMFIMEKYFTELLESGSMLELATMEDKVYTDVLELLTSTQNFRLPKEGIREFMVDSVRNIYERQLVLEKESNELAVEKVVKVQQELQKFEKAQNMQFSKRHIVQWFPQLTTVIKEEQELCKKEKLLGDRRIYAEYFLKVSPEKMATLALSELMKAIIKQVHRTEGNEMAYGVIPAGNLFEKIGELVNCEIIFQRESREFKNHQKALERKRNEEIKKASQAQKMSQDEVIARRDYEEAKNTQQYKMYMKPQARKAYLGKLASRIMRSSKSFDSAGHGSMNKHSKVLVGSVLTYLMKSILKFKNKFGFSIPLLTSEVRKLTPKAEFGSSVLVIDEEFIFNFIKQMEHENDYYLHMDRSLPVIMEPAPWIDYELGGYYLRPTTIMRYNSSSQQERAVKYADLYRVSRVLDMLSKVAWKINPKVLSVVEEVWKNGGGRGTIPHKFYDMKNYVYQFQVKEERDFKKKEQLERLVQEQRNVHSLRCDFLLKLNVAQSFSKIDKFYFPHNMDFRGRVYPIPPHLNHMGADLSRGLLLFSQGVKLGPSGVKWLKIHTANLMGFDKARLPEKLEFVEKNLGLIMDIARDPLTNTEWLNYEDCWQALSSILELSDAIKSGNPEEYVSHLHIHQDGSCNGLQHYAALGRDSEGAAQVNLDVLDKPGDIYSHVARMVNELIERDASNPDCPIYQLANKLKGNVKRKTIKQTVMTSVYGVTFIGAKEQIYRQIREQKFLDDEQEEYRASIELARYTMECIKNLFDRAHNIKKWLIECAGLITETNNPVSWITPMGVPVIQPYRTESPTDLVKTLTNFIVITKDSSKLPINRPRQKSAFPPNFVHSLDSTHMMYTAEQCFSQGIVFAAVHDSYWTHAASVERMNSILRQQFIGLHSEPLLENMRDSFKRRFPYINFPAVPARGQFNLERIKQSLYFFS